MDSARPIILYVHDLRASGVVRNAIDLARLLTRERPTTLLAGHDGGSLLPGVDPAVRMRTLAPAAGGRIAIVPALRRFLEREPPGLLVSMGNHGHASVWLASRGSDRHARVYRISQAIARGDGLRDRWRRAWMHRLARDAIRLILVGGANSAIEPFSSALATGRAVEIANGIDIERARQLAKVPAPHPWLEQAMPVVLGIGRLRPQKNFDLLIRAVAAAQAERPMRLAILGGGSADERARLAALGLGEDRLLLAGETDNVFAWLARAAVFALPSRWEGSSMALLEAMALSVPVIAANTAGDAAQVLGGGQYGVLAGNDATDWASALVRQTGPDAIRPVAPPSADDTLARYAEVLRAL